MQKKFTYMTIFFLVCTLHIPLQSMKKIIKLGGSVITQKSAHVGMAKEQAIDNVAQQIALYKSPLVLTHGTGSFGHPLYHAYNLENEFDLEGTVKVHKAEKQLNNIVMHSLHKHGIKAICIDPFYHIVCQDGRITHMPIDFIKELIIQGFIPVLFGTMVYDTKRKAYGLSSDQITTYLAEHLDIDQAGFASCEHGVYDKSGDIIPEINPVNFQDLKTCIGGSEHIDVTGGMLGKVEEAIEAQGLSSCIFNGEQQESISQFLYDEPIGTQILS